MSPAKPEEAWHAARLIPTTGIEGAQEQEERATSSLLAVMHAVRGFRQRSSRRLATYR